MTFAQLYMARHRVAESKVLGDFRRRTAKRPLFRSWLGGLLIRTGAWPLSDDEAKFFASVLKSQTWGEFECIIASSLQAARSTSVHPWSDVYSHAPWGIRLIRMRERIGMRPSLGEMLLTGRVVFCEKAAADFEVLAEPVRSERIHVKAY